MSTRSFDGRGGERAETTTMETFPPKRVKPSSSWPFALVLLLCLLPVVHASYSIYPELGSNEKFSGRYLDAATPSYTTYRVVDAIASQTEPIAFDADLDGATEIFIPVNGGVSIYEASDPTNSIGTIPGTPAISPVACDIDGDGLLDYVDVVTDGSSYSLVAGKFDADHNFVVFAQKAVTPTNSTGNIVCGDLFAGTGDARFYALYVDQRKYVNAWTAAGTAFAGLNISLGSSIEDENLYGNFSKGSHRVAFSETGGAFNMQTLFYFAGQNAYAYLPGAGAGTYATVNITPYCSGPSGYCRSGVKMGSVQTYGGVLSSGSVAVYHFDNDLGSNDATVPARSFYNVVRPSLSFGVRSLVGTNFSIGPGATIITNPFEGITSPTAFGLLRTSDSSDSLFSIMYDTQTAQPVINSRTYDVVVATTTGTVLNQTIFQLNNSGQAFGKTAGIFVADMNKDGYADIVQAKENSSSTYAIGYYSGITGYASFTSLTTIATSANLFGVTAQAVDLNDDGSPDLIINSAVDGQTYVIMSGGGVSTNRPLPFSVTVPTVGSNASRQKITSSITLTDYAYSVSCNIAQATTIWNEQFLPGYNFTLQNVSLNVVPGEQFLTYNGLQFTINATYPQFNLFKQANSGTNSVSRMRVLYDAPVNSSMDILLFGTDTQLAGFFRVNKTGSAVMIYKVVFGADPINVANATLSSNALDLSLFFTPVHDINGDFFSVDITLNGVALGSTSTAQFTGQNLASAQLFSNTAGTLLLHQFGLFFASNPTPDYVQFANGQRSTIGGVTVTSPAPLAAITGDGFTVTPDFNDVFYSGCRYSSAGTYTQRHYLQRIGDVLDYLNYRDVTVTVVSTPVNGSTIAGNQQDEFTTNLSSLADGLGLRDPASKLFFWFIISILVAIGLFLIHWMLGLTGFVGMLLIGAPLGFVPVWVLLIFVIICAAIGAMAYRSIASGA